MKMLATGLILCASLLTGCASNKNQPATSRSTNRVVELSGADLDAAKHGSSRGGMYIDVMQDNTLVFDDAPTDLAKLKQQCKAFAAKGGRVLTIRALDGCDAKLAADVQAAAVESGVPVIEVAKYARS